MAGIRGLVLDAISALLHKYGYEVKWRGYPVRGFSEFLEFAIRCGIAPRTVFDVGVGPGTPWLYSAFPGSKLVLIEALDKFRPDVEALAARHGADFLINALGAEPGRLRMRIPRLAATGASMLSRHPEFEKLEIMSSRDIEDEFCDVDVVTLDSVSPRWPAPYVLKLDVEGAELEVLRGATRTLADTELIIMEMSVLPRFDGEESFADRLVFLDRAGFRLFDIPEMTQTKRGGPLSIIDAAFVRKDNKLRVPGW